MKKILTSLLLTMTVCTVMAALSYDQIITAIFGSGNPDTGWATASDTSMVLALRAKNRETASTANASGVYNMPAGYQAPANTRARWNFEWSIKVIGGVISDYDYYLGIDNDPSIAPVFNYIDPQLIPDNSYGNDFTPNGAGVEGTAAALASDNNIVQQSHNITFYPFLGFDPNLDATYDFVLYAVAKGAGVNGARLMTVAIQVVVGAGGPPPPDTDGDGVPDYVDQCPTTIAGDAVDVNGCSVQDIINKCAVENSASHGDYVACVVEKANELFKAGTITKDERKFIITTAAQSDIGK